MTHSEFPTLIIRPVPAAVFALIATVSNFERAFSTSPIVSTPGARGAYLWAMMWGRA